MPADPSVWDALKIGGGSVAGALVAAFVKNFFTSGGTDAREFRQEYREEITRLKDDLKELRKEMDAVKTQHTQELGDLRLEIVALSRRNIHYLTGRSEARTLLNARERAAAESLTAWPDDPV